MSSIKLTQTTGNTLTDWLRAYIAQFSAVARPLPVALPVTQPRAEDVVRAERLFMQAVQENSNLELDWLWCATNMTSVAQQRYCFERALAINPSSDLAKRALAKLPQETPVEAVTTL